MSSNLFADVAEFQRCVLGNQQPPVVQPLDKTNGYEVTITGLEEELTELRDAVLNNDIAGQADALIDLIYFALGGLFRMGIPFQACWERVHSKNMTKVIGVKASRNCPNDAIGGPDWTPPNHDVLLNMPKAFMDAAELLAKKKQDYCTGVTRQDYFPFGHYSYAQMLHTKMLRVHSLLNVLENGNQPNFESLRDTLIDMLNYTSFYVEAIDEGIV
jgi:NTP pyrophosphatase (non-canonical NTP hydrolase)